MNRLSSSDAKGAHTRIRKAGRILVPVALIGAITGIAILVTMSPSPLAALAMNAQEDIGAVETRDAMLRLGLSDDALAAAGLSAAETTMLVNETANRLEAMNPSLSTLDANVADARRDVGRYANAVRSGTGSDDDVTALNTAQTALAAAESTRTTAIDGLFDAAVDHLTTSQQETLAAIRANDGWNLPTEFKASDRTAQEALALRKALAYERVAAENPDADENPDAVALLASTRAESDVSTAAANIAVSSDAVAQASDAALDGLDQQE